MISSHILTTKLYPPAPRPFLVPRPRLIERLNAGLQANRQLILISATAGFGKTTLASEWINSSHLDSIVAWVSLDEGDNDPTRFLYYLTAALQQIDSEIGANLLPVMQSSQEAPLFELAAQLINQIAISKKNVLLMLDDYHLITSDAVHQIVQLIIEHQPNRMHTAILTREDPPLPIPRMRVRGQVVEVRERDLRFTLAEAQAFLVETMGLDLSSEDVGILKERTEGWVAGMQLAALALEDYTDLNTRRAFIEAFAGSDRLIVDYLISEVLQRQSEITRKFLLDTSILERFCADLCDQVVFGVTGTDQSQSILGGLEQENMFLVPLDNQRFWYRYHHLFGEMLYHSLHRSSPDRIPDLHRRASEWFERKGFTQDAVKHALAAQDWDLCVALLDKHSMRLLYQGQGPLVMGWCQALPKTILEAAPEICIYYAWALVLTYRNDFLDLVEEKLQQAERAIQKPGLPAYAPVGQDGNLVPFRDWVIGHACVIRGQVLLGGFNMYIDPQQLISLSLKGLELLPEGEKATRSTCLINLAHAELMQNNPDKALKAFEEALPLMLEAKNFLGGVTNIFYQARLAYYLGQLDRAEMLCRHWKAKFLEMAGQYERDIPATRGLDIILGLLLMERNQFDEAETLIVQALDLVGWASWMEIVGFNILVRLRYLRGDYSGVDETLRRMATMGPQHTSCAEALRSLFEIRTSPDNPNIRSKAEFWVKKNSPNLGTPFALGIGPYHCDIEYISNLAWAKVQISLGRPQEALTFIEPALAIAEEYQLTFRIIELSIAQAMAHEAQNDHASAFAELEKALTLAQDHGYARVFNDGPELDRLLKEAAGRNILPGYVEQILAFDKPVAAAEKPVEAVRVNKQKTYPALVEPLSEREFEVLSLIANGLSNGQIGERLFIAPGTVKRHITNVYGKLSVKTRTQAIIRAREIGLLT